MRENDNFNEEYEVRLGDLFWSVLRNWRGLIVGMIIFGILIGLFGAVREYSKYRDPALKEKANKEYTAALEQYERSKEGYEAKIDNLNDWIDRLDSYRDSSLMLLMDPYDIQRSTITYYIDTGYEIMPGISYQNPDYTGSLLNSYAAAVARLPFDDLIDLPGGPDLTTAHTVNKYSSKKVCTAETDETTGLLTVTVIGDTEERCSVVMDAVKKTIKDNEAILKKAVGEHAVTIIGETTERSVDLDLANLQAAFANDYESNNNELTKTEGLLKDLKEPVKTVHSRRTILKQTIKFGILGLVIGLILSVLLYIFRDHDRSVSGLQRKYGIPVLGALGASGKKWRKADRKIASRLGVPDYTDESGASDYVSSAIRLFRKSDEALVLVGSASEDKIANIAELISGKFPDTEVRYGGNIRSSAKAVNELSRPCEVICVEEWPCGEDREIARELDLLRAMGKEPIGIILAV